MLGDNFELTEEVQGESELKQPGAPSAPTSLLSPALLGLPPPGPLARARVSVSVDSGTHGCWGARGGRRGLLPEGPACEGAVGRGQAGVPLVTGSGVEPVRQLCLGTRPSAPLTQGAVRTACLPGPLTPQPLERPCRRGALPWCPASPPLAPTGLPPCWVWSQCGGGHPVRLPSQLRTSWVFAG